MTTRPLRRSVRSPAISESGGFGGNWNVVQYMLMFLLLGELAGGGWLAVTAAASTGVLATFLLPSTIVSDSQN